MKRTEIENKAKSAQTDLKEKIEKAPVKSVAAGVLVGVLLSALSGILIPLVVIAATAIGVMWFVAENDKDSGTVADVSSVETEAESRPSDAPINGTSSSSKKSKSKSKSASV